MIRFSYTGRRHPAWKPLDANFFKWNSHGTPLPERTTHRPVYPNWLVYAPLFRNNVWVWSRGLKAGGPPPPVTQAPWAGFIGNVGRMMVRRG